MVRAGEIAPRRLGFASRKARDLRLAAAWRRVAGPGIADRARPERMRQGTLLLRVDDPSWLPTLEALLPRLLAGLNEAEPCLGVVAGRLHVAGEAEPREPRRCDARATPLPELPAAAPAEPDRSLDERRLRRAMERYLARRGDAQKP